MTDAEDTRLYDLLPAVYRLRDDPERGEPLKALMAVLGDEAAVIAENLAQLYDDLFVETAAPWVLPYIAELIGLPDAGSPGILTRAEVANAIGYRRRKGTAAVLEQLARDVTGWPARAVESFELLVATQHMNHVRPRNQGVVNVRDAARLAWAGSPFERTSERRPGHTVDQPDLTHLPDVRHISRRRGRYNIPNVGIHLWRLRPYALTGSPAAPGPDTRRFFFNPLGVDTQLFTLPVTEDEISQLAEPINVPMPISRRMLAAALPAYYGRSLSIAGIDGDDVVVCDLRDTASGWGHTPPAGKVAIDPVLGRIAFPADHANAPLVSYHAGFSFDIGGGEYNRVRSFDPTEGSVLRVRQIGTGAPHATIAGALTALGTAGGIVEIADNGRYVETPALDVTGRRVQLRAADQQRPTLVLAGQWEITGDAAGELVLNGLLIAGGPLRVAGPGRVVLRHCTLVPTATSVIVASPETEVVLDSCIVGGARVVDGAKLSARASIIDAGETGIAYAAESGDAGGDLRLEQCTVLGTVHARVLDLASNTIFLGPVTADRKQTGCVRYSYLPAGSRTPRRYRCQPEREADAARLRPVLTSARYGDPGYAQLHTCTPEAITRGADDESEMGVFHDLFQPQRERYLQTRLEEYLRFGLEVGIFFAT